MFGMGGFGKLDNKFDKFEKFDGKFDDRLEFSPKNGGKP